MTTRAPVSENALRTRLRRTASFQTDSTAVPFVNILAEQITQDEPAYPAIATSGATAELGSQRAAAEFCCGSHARSAVSFHLNRSYLHHHHHHNHHNQREHWRDQFACGCVFDSRGGGRACESDNTVKPCSCRILRSGLVHFRTSVTLTLTFRRVTEVRKWTTPLKIFAMQSAATVIPSQTLQATTFSFSPVFSSPTIKNVVRSL